MGLDMYLYSVPKYKGSDFELNGDKLVRLNYVPNKVSYPQTVVDFYKSHYNKEEYTFLTEEAYWRKAYNISNYLNSYYENMSTDYGSKFLTKQDIQGLREYAQEYIDKQTKPAKVRVVGYVNQAGKDIMFPKTLDKLILEPVLSDDENYPKVDGRTTFYTSLPLEYLAEEDWELGHAMYTVKECDRILSEFDFENRWLFYVASY